MPASPTCGCSARSGWSQLDHPVDVGRATDAALDAGVWLRPFRDLVYTMPPYVTADDDARDASATASPPTAVRGRHERLDDWLAERRAARDEPG